MRKKLSFLIVMALFMGAVLSSCKGDEGPMGPEGQQGQQGPEGQQGPTGANPAFIEIVNSSLNVAIPQNATGKVVFRVNPSNANVPTGSGSAIDNWQLDQTGIKTRASYVTEPNGFKLVSIQKDGNNNGQYIATIENTGAENTYVNLMALVLNTGDGALVSSSTFSLTGMIVVAKLFEQMNTAERVQESVDVMKRLGVVNQIHVFPRQVRVEGVPEVLTNSGIDLWLLAPFFYHDDNNGAIVSGALGRAPNWAICNDGELAWERNNPHGGHPSGSWLRMVCPRDEEYLDYRINYLKLELRKCNFTGVSLDFMRHYVYWEGAHNGTDLNKLRNSCFCDVCVGEFMKTITLNATQQAEWDGFTTVPEKADFILGNPIRQFLWTSFKCATIDETIKKVLYDLRLEFPDLKANLHAVPWAQNDFGGAIRKIAGQDFELLSKRLDQITPMTYHRLVLHPAQWINYVTSDVVNVVNGKIPIIPVIEGRANANLGDVDRDYEDALINAIKSPSAGVVIWRFEALTESRIEITEKILGLK